MSTFSISLRINTKATFSDNKDSYPPPPSFFIDI